jgi:hypothetical protein
MNPAQPNSISTTVYLENKKYTNMATAHAHDEVLYNERYRIVEKLESRSGDGSGFGKFFKIKDEKDQDIQM